MSDSTDAALAAGGDYEAFQRLYRRYLSRVYSLCRRLSGSAAKGQELTEHVFVKAWEKLPDLNDESAFGAWLRRLATDVVLNAPEANENTVSRVAEEGSANRWIDVPNTWDVAPRLDLSQAIDGLPAPERRILVLHDVEGYEYDEIAEILGVTAGTSKAKLHRARVLLRDVLSQ
jgi:RNA polymerase sigma factor (sigma-70 family)